MARFSLRRLLGVVTAACLLLAACKFIISSGLKNDARVGCVLAMLAVVMPAVFGVGVAATSGYSRAAMIGGLVPSLVAAIFFAVSLNGSYQGWSVQDVKSFEPVIGRMIYYRHSLLLFWSLVPIGVVAGIAAHWFLGPKND